MLAGSQISQAICEPTPLLRRDRSNLRINQNKKAPKKVLSRFGLPDRIRTYGLQSRSLTRYPAVPRVEIKLKNKERCERWLCPSCPAFHVCSRVACFRLRKFSALLARTRWTSLEKAIHNRFLLITNKKINIMKTDPYFIILTSSIPKVKISESFIRLFLKIIKCK